MKSYNQTKDYGTTNNPWLTPQELALTICTPFVFEAILALLEEEFAELIHPPIDNDITTANLMQSSWQTYKKEESAWARHAQLLDKKGQQEDAKALRWRQLYQFAYLSGELWQYCPYQNQNAIGWLNESLQQILALAPVNSVQKCNTVNKVLGGDLVVQLTRTLFISAQDIGRFLEDGERNETFKELIGGEGENQWSCKPLNVIPMLAIASRMTIDPRRLHDAVAEHIGLTSGFELQTILTYLENYNWPASAVDGGSHDYQAIHYSLNVACEHQIMDFALEHSTKELNDIASSTRQYNGKSPIAHLFFDTKGMTPKKRYGVDCYTRPHVRFGVDEKKTMQLLMGEKLYGDPQLALRELYQNALDACRYRDARVNYQNKVNPQHELSFKGRISFKAGREETTNRPYIECCDNGIGMNETHLERLFAHGGSRFAESHDFQVERAKWKSQGIEFYPNSRFGVGVLSYFMLADQIDVHTSRLKENASGREILLKVVIEGSNSIFQVQKPDENLGFEHGTSIRLYLSDNDSNPDNVLASIKEWLVLPEYQVDIEFCNGKTDVLRAGKYCENDKDRKRNLQLIPIPESARDNGQIRVNWAIANRLGHEYQLILADGIKLNSRLNGLDFVQINHADDYKAELSVDRLSLMSKELTLQQVRKVLCEGGWKALIDGPQLTFDEMAKLIASQPLALEQLNQAILAGSVEFNLRAKTGELIDISGVGLSALDSVIFNHYLIEELQGSNRERIFRIEPMVCQRLRVHSQHNLPLSIGLMQLASFNMKLDKPSLFISAACSSYLSRTLTSGGDIQMPLSINSISRYAIEHGLTLKEVCLIIEPITHFDSKKVANSQIINAVIGEELTSKQIQALYIEEHGMYCHKCNFAMLMIYAFHAKTNIAEMARQIKPLIRAGLTRFDKKQLAELVEKKLDLTLLSFINLADYHLVFVLGKLLDVYSLVNLIMSSELTAEQLKIMVTPYIDAELTTFTREQFNAVVGDSLSSQTKGVYLDTCNSYGLVGLKALVLHRKNTQLPAEELASLYKELIAVNVTSFDEEQLAYILNNKLSAKSIDILGAIYNGHTIGFGRIFRFMETKGGTLYELSKAIGELVEARLIVINTAEFKCFIELMNKLSDAEQQLLTNEVLYSTQIKNRFNIAFLLQKSLESRSSFVQAYHQYKNLLNIPATARELIEQFVELSPLFHENLLHCWDQENNRISTLAIAVLLIENNPNWQDINLGLDLFEVNNTDVSEAREFVAFCQKEMEGK